MKKQNEFLRFCSQPFWLLPSWRAAAAETVETAEMGPILLIPPARLLKTRLSPLWSRQVFLHLRMNRPWTRSAKSMPNRFLSLRILTAAMALMPPALRFLKYNPLGPMIVKTPSPLQKFIVFGAVPLTMAATAKQMPLLTMPTPFPAWFPILKNLSAAKAPEPLIILFIPYT